MKRLALVIVAGAIFATCATDLLAQSTDATMTERMTAIEKAVADLSKQVTALNTLLRMTIPSPIEDIKRVTVDIASAQLRGSATAKVVLIEFGDFQCPYCGQFAHTTYAEIDRAYVSTGKVRYAFINLPLEQLHPDAFKAAEAAACAAVQGKFWPMHDRLFENQQALRATDLPAHAKNVGVDPALFETCFSSGSMRGRIQQDVTLARGLGLNGTPAFLLGTVSADGTVEVKNRIVGARPFGVFQAAIEALTP